MILRGGAASLTPVQLETRLFLRGAHGISIGRIGKDLGALKGLSITFTNNNNNTAITTTTTKNNTINNPVRIGSDLGVGLPFRVGNPCAIPPNSHRLHLVRSKYPVRHTLYHITEEA